MGKIIDRSTELYPNLKGAEFLEYQGEDVPEEVRICKSNIFSGEGKDCCIPNLSYWGWECASGYHYSFATPEDALKNYKEFLEGNFKSDKVNISPSDNGKNDNKDNPN